MANTYLTRTNSSPTNPKKYTWSSWNKIDSGGWYPFFSTTHQGGHSYIGFGASSSSFGLIEHGDSAGTLYYLSTSSIQRDTSGWYHVVVQFDSTQSTASDRIKIYINNLLQTSFVNSNYPSQNLDSWFVDATTIEIGRRSQGSGQYYSGLISHAHFIDGTIYAPSTFGETDSTTGEWKINSNPGISTANYGNNGFWMFKDNNSLNDNSGNSNNFTLGGGTLTKTEDCPSNVFATGNPLFSFLGTWSNGNNSIVGSTSSGVRPQMWSTLGAKTGKFYAEAKYTDKTGGMVGVSDYTATNTIINAGTYQGGATGSVGFWNDGSKYVNDSSSNYGSAWNNNDIIQIALDLDNECVYFGINGTWQNSGNPASGASKTGAIALTNTRDEDWFMSWGDGSQGNSATCHVNYGNGYFATTAVSSAGTNASNNGIFEYDVPTGYTALSTKGLNL